MLLPARLSRLLQRSLSLLGLLLLMSGSAWAQTTQNDGTIYSRFGVGHLLDYPSPQVVAMGGGGYGMRSLNYINLNNPASWSDQLLVRALAGGSYEMLTIQDGSGLTGRLSGASLTTIQFSLPLLTRKLGVGVALQPYSTTNYLIRSAGQLQVAPDSTVGYEIRRAGQGGLQQITGGFGYRLSNFLSVGASVHVIFGTIEHVQRTIFARRDYARATRTDGTRLSGVTGTVGALLSVTDMLGEDDALSLGAAFTLPTTLNGTYAQTLGEGLGRDTLATTDGEVKLPWKLGLGLAYHPDERWTVTLNGSYAPWSNFESSFDAVEGDLPLFGDDLLANRFRGSVGTEFMPSGGDLTDPYLDRVAYRLGAYFESGYARAPTAPSTTINTLALTGGLSLPTRLYGTRLDINLHVGTRGSTKNGLVRDLFYGVSINVNIGERWFQRRKLR